MNNALQAFLTLLSKLAVVVQLNSAYYNASTAYTGRRNTINSRDLQQFATA